MGLVNLRREITGAYNGLLYSYWMALVGSVRGFGYFWTGCVFPSNLNPETLTLALILTLTLRQRPQREGILILAYPAVLLRQVATPFRRSHARTRTRTPDFDSDPRLDTADFEKVFPTTQPLTVTLTKP